MTVQRIAALLHEAAETHHTVYRITDGTDADWATWYADWLIKLSELPELLARRPVRSHLVHALVDLERKVGAARGWELAYAAHLVEWFGPQEAPEPAIEATPVVEARPVPPLAPLETGS
jgi:hypothetical protein